MSLLTAARIVAVGLSLTTFVFLFLHDSFRSDNLFLVPDLVLCTALVVAAALPGRFAVPALIAAFGMTCGVRPFRRSRSTGSWASQACSGWRPAWR
jgi:hypothetical protein